MSMLTRQNRDDIVYGMTAQEYITIKTAAALLPCEPSKATMSRYVNRGLNGVRLRVVRIAGRVFTSRQWIADFLEQSSRQDEPVAAFNMERQPDLAGIGRRLKRAGVRLNAKLPGARMRTPGNSSRLLSGVSQDGSAANRQQANDGSQATQSRVVTAPVSTKNSLTTR